MLIINQIRLCDINKFPKELIQMLLNFIDIQQWYYELEWSFDVPVETHYISFHTCYKAHMLTREYKNNHYGCMNIMVTKPQNRKNNHDQLRYSV